MKKLLLLSGILFVNFLSYSQQGKKFKVIYKVKSSPLKDQQSSGTCWSFATTSFLETEAIRKGKPSISLSPMFYVHPAYLGKSKKFIETKGKSWLDAGDLTFSVLKGYETYGAVPESVYNGIIKGDWQHDHVEMDNLIKTMISSVATSGYGRIKPNSWKQSLEGVLNAYLGKAPEKFKYNGKEFTPKSFADFYLGINPKDYVEITSYNHLKYYTNSTLKIPANWGDNKYLNLPIQDFESVIENALKKGYSLAWDGDASEPNFNFEKGVAELTKEQESLKITQDLRQQTFEDKSTTDDHNMHLIGKATDTSGKIYYILKNSEGNNEQGGYMYMSKKALLLKTISVLVHKEAIPENIQSKIY
ncbi:C1 family peptidase [Tenacibaculum jejuense]|uniref:Aminopeptidase n=1 Tax=Tenacibaculum jejuense TaxID=584609 RepID=A0A238UDY1_9FLAO|nr:C1 family peptidase [Tenacibaculum jejuense]SNR17292.1 Aminopeptidase C [Tenacibaculum jejuense]